MVRFDNEYSETDMDFLAFSVARMEHDSHSFTIHSSELSMPRPMYDIFLQRLEVYREAIKTHDRNQ